MGLLMNKEKHLHAIGSKCSQALVAASALSDIVLEKYFAGILPETRQLSINN